MLHRNPSRDKHEIHNDTSQVVEAATEDYSEVQDLLKRFATLKDANKNLNEAQTRDEGETERLRSEFSSYTKERSDGMFKVGSSFAVEETDLWRKRSEKLAV